MRSRIAWVAITLAMLSACGPANQQSTPTLMVMGLSLPTTTPFDTAEAPASLTPIVIYTTTPTIEPPPSHTPSATPKASATPRQIGTQVGAPVTCQGVFGDANLLANGGFEGGRHAEGIDSVQVPDSWSGFWTPEGTKVLYDPNNNEGYQRPEMMIIPKLPPYTNPPRIAEGSQALMISGNQRAFDAGVLQVVSVSAGDVLCLTGEAHAWSNRFSDDPFSSTLDSLDDERNANVQLGIDPQGGSDPFSPSIQWGTALHSYNVYKVMNAVQVTAPGQSISVFVRGFMLWRFDHNEMYFDNILLRKVAPPPTAEPPVTTTVAP